MKRSFPAIVIAALLAAAPLFAGGGAEETTSADKPAVYGSILPVQFLIDRIGGEAVESGVVVLPGESPATYEPAPRQMSRLSDARLLFRVGVPFENGFIPKLRELAPDLDIIDLREGISLRTMETAHTHEEDDDDHGEEEHAAGSPDPHIWMSPRNMIIMAGRVRDALSALVPEHAADFGRNHDLLAAELRDLDERLTKALAPYRGRSFFVYHPAFGYFADDYGLRQIPLEIEGKEPSPRQLTGYIEEAKEMGVNIIFVQPEFPKQSAKNVAEAIGGSVVPVTSLSIDYIESLEAAARALEEGLR